MSGVRHHHAPVMPLGPSVFVSDLRHLVGDLDLSLHRDQFLMEITHTLLIFVSFIGNNYKK